jgi:hypothetical protein
MAAHMVNDQRARDAGLASNASNATSNRPASLCSSSPSASMSGRTQFHAIYWQFTVAADQPIHFVLGRLSSRTRPHAPWWKHHHAVIVANCGEDHPALFLVFLVSSRRNSINEYADRSSFRVIAKLRGEPFKSCASASSATPA